MKYLTLICALMLVVACGQKSDAPATDKSGCGEPAKTTKTIKDSVPADVPTDVPTKVAMKTVTLNIEGMT